MRTEVLKTLRATRATILVGDDTDLLVLLLFHAEPDCHDLYFIPEPKSNTVN